MNDIAYFTIDVGRDETIVNQITLKDGKYRRFLRVTNGSLLAQAGVVAVHILKHKPAKVFIDDIGIGAGFSEWLKKELSELDMHLKDDGTVIYNR